MRLTTKTTLLLSLAGLLAVFFELDRTGSTALFAAFIASAVVTVKLAGDAERLHRLAMTDDLTGLHNLRSFELQLGRMLENVQQTHGPIALLALDVDRLKSLNDRYGHLTGADAVRTIGLLIGSSLPTGAVACRYGGDEFIVAVPRCSRASAVAVADALRAIVSRTSVVLDGRCFPAGTLSISIGVACSEAADRPANPSHDANRVLGERLFRLADAELYRAKASGRNVTCAA